ncbi:hypothetical protein CO731_03001 [Aminobacter sp. MSH1]|uniref:hypothetical protein n=1 Tax=Aminobacter sp. MSH1 TaxID=374606 RepID=UPI000D504A2F|nr:hypothetical protein [Aminobacter sp. MSH1]AWC23529.1 hypothetical protein CO731_03001 [Aminobacter sp. MSH1]
MLVGRAMSGAVSNVRTADPLATPARPEAANRNSDVASDVMAQAALPATNSHIYVPAKPVQQAAPVAMQDPSRTRMSEVDDAHRTAWSALNNERFRLAMEKLGDVRTSDAVMLMRPVEGAGTDIKSALARYEENS